MQQKTLIVAITGGIASGKTAATDALAGLGITVLDADLVAREVVQPGTAGLQAVVNRFGPSIVDAQGELDRAELRQRVFADPGERRALEAILHPLIREELRQRAVSAEGPYAVLAIPLLVETAAYDWVDRVVVIDVDEPLQVHRLTQRDGISTAAAQTILAAQASRQQRLQIATDVIINDAGLTELGQAVQRLDLHLRRAAQRRD